MKSINFNEGYKEYAINGDENRVIRIRVADFNLPKRIESAKKTIDDLIVKYQGNSSPSDMAEFDKEIREVINTAFGTDVCTPAFGAANVCTLVGDGEMLFIAFFEAFMPLIEADLKAMDITKKIGKPEVRPEVKKYIESRPAAKPVAGLADPYGTAMPDVSGLTPEQKKELIAQLLT